ncbi:MAG TPA: SDR family oxidoreductase [Streptosporangiaceae bacterium]
MTNSARPDGPAVDPRHLLVIGAGPGLGGAIAQRFAQGGYHLTLLARHTDGLAKLASDLADTGAVVDTVAADASDPEGLRATLTSLYAGTGAPGVLVYNASMLTPDSLLSSDVTHLHQAYDVDVVGPSWPRRSLLRQCGPPEADHPVHRRRLGGPSGPGLGHPLAGGGDHARCRPGGRRHTRCQHHHRRADPAGHTVQPGPDCREVLVGRAIGRRLAKRIPLRRNMNRQHRP